MKSTNFDAFSHFLFFYDVTNSHNHKNAATGQCILKDFWFPIEFFFNNGKCIQWRYLTYNYPLLFCNNRFILFGVKKIINKSFRWHNIGLSQVEFLFLASILLFFWIGILLRTLSLSTQLWMSQYLSISKCQLV